MSDLTLEDIAKMAGVSRATVSRIINNQVGSRSKARERVLSIIEEVGYQPNMAARSLAAQRSYVIGHVIPQRADFILKDPFFIELSQAIGRACAKTDYIMALFMLTSKAEEIKLYSRIANRGMLDGVIVHGGQGAFVSELIDKLSATKMPFVVGGSLPKGYSNISYVDVDNINGAYNAVAHLLRLGRRRIATVAGNLDILPGPGIARLEGYEKAIKERGLEVEEDLIAEADFTEEGGYYAVNRLLRHKPDAIFVASDRMATGVLRALSEYGISVPDDIAVIGFDDLEPSRRAKPPLTTIRLPVDAMGENMANMLFDIIENGPEPPRRVVLDTELVVRESCGAR